MAKSMEEIKNNLYKDIENASSKDIDKIYEALADVVKKFDRDSGLKNFVDLLKDAFKTKRGRCLKFIDDIFDSCEKLDSDEKSRLKKELLQISNIHRTFVENLIALLGAT